MIVALGFCHKDYLAAEKLFRWMVELDGKQPHTFILVASNGLESKVIELVKAAAKESFIRVETIMPKFPDERGWPASANTLFLTAFGQVRRTLRKPWLWIEPDCVPLKPKWIESLFDEYAKIGKPFMGCHYELPWPHLTGCAIYPPDIEHYSLNVMKPGIRAWDMVDTDTTLANSHHSTQFHHEWGNFKYNIAPTFPSQASVGLVRDDAVIFHRCKDGSLIDRLREKKRFPRICKVLAKIGSKDNGYQGFEDSHAPAAVQIAA